MAFTGLSTNNHFTADQVAEDISRLIATLSPKETEVLDWLGDSDVFATSTLHEWMQDYMLPNYIVNSTAIASATAATGIMVAGGLGQALTEGTLLELSDGGELLQVTSVVGANSVLVSRAYGGTANGSLAAGGQLYVRAMAGIEGQDHNGSHVRRLGDRKANTVGYFNIPVAASGTQLAVNLYGNDSYNAAVAKGLVDVLHQLEKEIIRGKLNSTNSLGTTSATRTMKGIRDFLTTINSTHPAAASFAANPHTYIGNLWDSIYQQGANVDTEEWAIVAGRTLFRNISDMNDTKIEDSSDIEGFKRVVRRYTGPFGSARVILSRVLSATELLLVPRNRFKVVPLQGRSFRYEELAKTGDNVKGQITGEYTIEVHHENAMARLTTS
jgi:hypothetical protein